MERKGLLSRIHGAAVANEALYELPLNYRGAHRGEKRRIAQRAAALVSPGMKVGLTGGTTTMELARAIAEIRDLTVVSNAMNVAWELVLRPNVRLMVTGGVARPISYELVGPVAESSLKEVNLDVAFMGADGISLADGVTSQDESEAATIRALIARANEVHVVADRTKFNRRGFSRVCPLSAVSTIITDRGISQDLVKEYAESGVHIITC